jgi:hypothetical protein
VNQYDLPIGSMWLAYHNQGEDIVLVLGEPEYDGSRSHVPCLVLTTGQHVETWIANFSVWERLQ